jgi:hypothetical protein
MEPGGIRDFADALSVLIFAGAGLLACTVIVISILRALNRGDW